MMRIKYTSECECGGTMSSTTLDLTQDPGGEVVIDLDMLGQFSVTCDKCGCQTFIGDVQDVFYSEGECTHGGSEEDDDE